MAVSEFVFVVDAVDSLALCAHLHEQVRIVIGFLGVEGYFFGLVDLEVLIDFLANILFVQPFPENAFFLG